MCLTHNEGKSAVTEKFIKNLKAKSIKQWQLMIVTLILVDQYSNTSHRFIGTFHQYWFIWLAKLNQIIKHLNSKLVIESG